MLERIVHKQITTVIIANNKLNSRQSGSRAGFSSQTALLRVCHDIRHAVNEGCATVLVLFDFSKAFDTVVHSKLVVKFRRLGFVDGALRWILSYLTVSGCSG